MKRTLLGALLILGPGFAVTASAQQAIDPWVVAASNYDLSANSTLVIDTRSGKPVYFYALRRQRTLLTFLDPLVGIERNPVQQQSSSPTLSIDPNRMIRIMVIEYSANAISGTNTVGALMSQTYSTDTKDWSVFVQPTASTNATKSTSSSILDAQNFQTAVDVTSTINQQITDAKSKETTRRLAGVVPVPSDQQVHVLAVYRTFSLNTDGNLQLAVVGPNQAQNADGSKKPTQVSDVNAAVDTQLAVTGPNADAAKASLVTMNEASQYSLANAFSPTVVASSGNSVALGLATQEYAFGPGNVHIDAIGIFEPTASSTNQSSVSLGEGLSYSLWWGNPYAESGKHSVGFAARLTFTLGVEGLSLGHNTLGSFSKPFIAFGVQIPIGGGTSDGSAKNKGQSSGS